MDSPEYDIKQLPLTRLGLIALVSSLIISGIIAIIIFLIGDFGETQGKTLATTVSLAGLSILSLPSLWHLERAQYKLPGRIGLLSSFLSFIMLEILIWGDPDGDAFFKPMITLYIITFATNHALLMLLIRTLHNVVLVCKNTTILVICILGAAIIAAVWLEVDPPDFILRLFGALVVLNVVGTIITPILARILRSSNGFVANN